MYCVLVCAIGSWHHSHISEYSLRDGEKWQTTGGPESKTFVSKDAERSKQRSGFPAETGSLQASNKVLSRPEERLKFKKKYNSEAFGLYGTGNILKSQNLKTEDYFLFFHPPLPSNWNGKMNLWASIQNAWIPFLPLPQASSLSFYSPTFFQLLKREYSFPPTRYPIWSFACTVLVSVLPSSLKCSEFGQIFYPFLGLSCQPQELHTVLRRNLSCSGHISNFILKQKHCMRS